MVKNTKKEQETKTGHKQIGSKRAIYIGTFIVLIIIVVTFVGGPLIELTGNNQRGRIVFGTYARKDIDYRSGNYFANVYEFLADRMNNITDNNMFQFQFRSLWRDAFDRTTEHVATLVQGEKSRAVISEEAIEKSIIQSPRFQENGRFSAELYRNAGSQELFSLRNLTEEIMIASQVRSDLLEDLRISDDEKQFTTELQKTERSFNIVTFAFDEYSDEGLREYAQEHEDIFHSIELSRITVQSMEDAEEVLAQITSEENTFEDAARLYSTDSFAEQGGNAGRMYVYEFESLLDTEDKDALLALNSGDYSNIFSTKNDEFVFFRLNSSLSPFDDANFDIIQEYIESKDPGEIERHMTERAEQFRLRVKELDSLSAAASEYDKEVFSTELIRMDYGNAMAINSGLVSEDVPSLSSAAYNAKVLESMFSLKSGDISEALTLQRTLLVMELEEEKVLDEIEQDGIKLIYDGMVLTFLDQYYRDAVVQDDKLNDFFSDTYERYVAPPAQTENAPEETEVEDVDDSTDNSDSES